MNGIFRPLLLSHTPAILFERKSKVSKTLIEGEMSQKIETKVLQAYYLGKREKIKIILMNSFSMNSLEQNEKWIILGLMLSRMKLN